MDFLGDWLLLIVAILLIGGAVVVGLVTTRGRRARQRGTTDALAPTETAEAPPGEAPVEEAPVAEARVAEAPVEEAPVEEAPAPPALEKPEGTASRLVRLRQRLSRSQGGLGKGLLALLSRDRLDEDTWEDIEDTLLTADIGVAPTQELVDKLRTRLRV